MRTHGHPARTMAPAIPAGERTAPEAANPLWSRLARVGALQAKLRVGAVDDPLEREADRVAAAVVSGKRAPLSSTAVSDGRLAGGPSGAVQRMCAECEEEQLQTKRPGSGPPGPAGGALLSPAGEARIAGLRGGGEALSPALRGYFEPHFGRDLSAVRLHTGAAAVAAASEVSARAFTVGPDIAFGAGELRPETPEGRTLLAHELTHTVQQGAARDLLQRDTAAAPSQPAAAGPDLGGPLTDEEWQRLEIWQSRGEVGVDPLTGDAAHNASVVAAAVFCSRWLFSGEEGDGDDPLLCVDPELTQAHPGVRALVPAVEARGPIINWTQVSEDDRIFHVMRLLVDTHGLPANGAAGIVGNLLAESHLLPNKIERAGRRIPGATPLTDRDFSGRVTDFTAEQVMNRDSAARQGPAKPGVGLAQWTSGSRRSRLFQHTFAGREQGAAILFNMDAQVDFLVTELRTRFPGVHRLVTARGVSVNDASDEVVLRFEAPRAVLDAAMRPLPRTNPAVLRVLERRRANAERALRVFLRRQPR